jgi:segregation and condensation protein B
MQAREDQSQDRSSDDANVCDLSREERDESHEERDESRAIDDRQLCCMLEALLFVSDGPVQVSRLGQVLEVDAERVESALTKLAEEYRGRGLRLLRSEGTVQMVTAPEMAAYVERFLGVQTTARLSNAALETLAIIAYKQPITRASIEALRGVNVSRALATLQARSLVREVGRVDGPGRPALFGTTPEFLQYFGMENLTQLPALEITEERN